MLLSLRLYLVQQSVKYVSCGVGVLSLQGTQRRVQLSVKTIGHPSIVDPTLLESLLLVALNRLQEFGWVGNLRAANLGQL